MLSQIIYFTGFLCISVLLFNVVGAERIQTTTSAAQRALQNSINIALLNCYNYGEFQYPNKSTSLRKDEEADCVNIKVGNHAEPKEYPHMAAIGYGKEFKDVDWECSGSLISEKFVLSLASCSEFSTSGPAKWALLGTATPEHVKNGTKSEVYEIVKRHIHPSYDPRSRHNDIILFELNSTVTLSPFIRPACLYTPSSIPIGTKASVAGWKTKTIGNAIIPQLKLHILSLEKAPALVVEDKMCETLTSDGDRVKNFAYDSKTMTCSGKLLQNNGCLNATDYGSPLQIPVDEEPCMWNVVGITLIRPTCEAEDPKKYPGVGNEGVYVEVSHYLEWIQKIVWP